MQFYRAHDRTPGQTQGKIMDHATEGPTLAQLVTTYLDDRSPEGLRRLRAAIAGSSTFDPDFQCAAVVGHLAEEGRHEDVVRALTQRMPGAALNPSAHAVLSAAHEALGHTRAARRERLLARIAVSSILSTGDGTQERPWSVLRIADEYDVMRAKGMTPVGQSAHAIEGRLVDRHETGAGDGVWFVVEDPARTLTGASA